MLVDGVERLKGKSRLKNCRVQSLCDLLLMNRIDVNPHFLHLSCCDTLLCFAEVIQNNILLPFVASFYADFEERFLKGQKLPYVLDHNLISIQAMRDELKSGNPFMVLCDANSILRRKKNAANSQVSVCSGITVIGYNFFGDFIYSQYSEKRGFPSISSKLLSYARSFEVLPSSPDNIAIRIEQSETANAGCRYNLSDYDYLLCKVRSCLKNFMEAKSNDTINMTNKSIAFYYGYNAKEKLLDFVSGLTHLLENKCVDPMIIDKVFALKMKMLRKSMISGTSTLNRAEFAESLNELYFLNPTVKLERLVSGFRASATGFRNIVRLLGTVDNNLHQKEVYLSNVINEFQSAFLFEEQLIEEFLS